MEEIDKRYEFIGELAVALHAKRFKMSFNDLNSMLKYNGYVPYGNSRGAASAVRAAHAMWAKKDDKISRRTSSAIACTYVDKEGKLLGLKIKFKIK